MSSAASLASTVRQDAGIDTLPFASILLSNLEANSSIRSSRRIQPTQDLEPRDARPALLPLQPVRSIPARIWRNREEAKHCAPYCGLRAARSLWPPPESYPSERAVLG